MTTVKDTTPTETDVEIIAADPYKLHLEGADIDVFLEKLRTRQLFKFLKILTVGAGAALADLKISPETDVAELTQELIAIVLISIPEAEDEAMAFLQSMVKPIDLIDPERSKDDRKTNVEKYQDLWSKLDNPEPVDTFALITRIVQNEAPNMVALGKQIAALIPSAAKLTNSSKTPSKKSTRAAS